MSFNVIAETSRKLDYSKIHAEIFIDDLPFDFIPMPNLGVHGGDALGICVPLKNSNASTWEQLKPVLKVLRAKFNCDVYDLYGGQKLGLFNSKTIKKNLLLK